MRRRSFVRGLVASLPFNLGLFRCGLVRAMGEDTPVDPTLLREATRLLRFDWVPFEVGAPTIDPHGPFGSDAPLADLARLDIALAPVDIRNLYAATMNGLARFVAATAPCLPPGSYVLDPADVRQLRALSERIPDLGLPLDLGLAPDGRFAYTREHAAILPRLRWQPDHPDDDVPLQAGEVAPRRDADTGETAWPVVGVDPKRPYGDMTYAEADMAEALGIAVGVDTAGYARLAPETEARLTALHHTTPAAMRVLVLYGKTV